MSYMTITGVVASLLPLVIFVYETFKVNERLKKRRTVKNVLFANSLSGCCGQRSQTDSSNTSKCPNQYCSQKNVGVIVELIDNSQHSICLALYTLNLDSVRKALISAKKRGVRVRVVTTEDSMKKLSQDFMLLHKNGIPIRSPKHGAERLLHHKFCIIDGESDAKQLVENDSVPVLLNGSMNWTMNSMTSNWDNIIVTSKRKLVEEYQNEFDNIWRSLKKQ